jgi:hypothetical protein
MFWARVAAPVPDCAIGAADPAPDPVPELAPELVVPLLWAQAAPRERASKVAIQADKAVRRGV